jgi:hypothetical protein
MNKIIDRDNEGRFANGQISRDLRGNPDATESKIRFEVANVTERCCDEAREESSAPESWEFERQRDGTQFLPEQVGADERLPGYLHEPHMPQFEPRSVRNVRKAARSSTSFALNSTSVGDYCRPIPTMRETLHS